MFLQHFLIRLHGFHASLCFILYVSWEAWVSFGRPKAPSSPVIQPLGRVNQIQTIKHKVLLLKNGGFELVKSLLLENL